MGILEKIAEIEREIARTQKNKGMKNTEMSKTFDNQCSGLQLPSIIWVR